MYETFFDLHHRPFPSVPASDYYMPFESIELARTTIERVIDRAEGPALLMAPAGMGKTLLCHLIAKRFQEEFSVAILANSKLCSRRTLLQNILFELNLPFRDMEEGELRLSLMDFLKPETATDRGMLLIIDEAHTVPMPLLEELRLITNFVRNGEPRVRLMLAGSASLEERFAHPRMASFQQRVAARCYLHSMSRDEVREYIQGQLFRAGPGRIEFTEDAFHAVHSASDGIPRLVNQICDHTLLLASVGGVTTINAAGVEEAWADLQQLPTPWSSDETQQSGEHFIEFGSLDDDPFSEAEDPTLGFAENGETTLDEESGDEESGDEKSGDEWLNDEQPQVEETLVEETLVEETLENTNVWSSDGWGTGVGKPVFADDVDEPDFDSDRDYEQESPETDTATVETSNKSAQVTDQVIPAVAATDNDNTLEQALASSFWGENESVPGVEGFVIGTDWITNFSCVVNTPTGNLEMVESLLQQAGAPVDVGELRDVAGQVDPEDTDGTAENSATGSEVVNELDEPDVIPLASDPFGGDFQEETLIYDPSEETTSAWHNAPSVHQIDIASRETVVEKPCIQVHEDKALDNVDLPDHDAGSQPVAFPAPALQIGFDLSDGIVLPFRPSNETTEHVVVEPGKDNDESEVNVNCESERVELDLETQGKAVACDLNNTDDRDLLIIEESPTDIVVSAPTYEPMAERREYPQLFDTLRQEH